MTQILRSLTATAEVLAALLIVPVVMALAMLGLTAVVLRAAALPLASVAVMGALIVYATRTWPIF